MAEAKIAVWLPGQAIKIGPDIKSLSDNSLDAIVSTIDSAMATVLPNELVAEVLSESPKVSENTQIAQLRSLRDSTIMWQAFLTHSFNKEQTVAELMATRQLRVQVSGDSFGALTAAYLPGPYSSMDENAHRFILATKATMQRSLPMLSTPHAYEEGGMMAIVKLNARSVKEMVAKVNEKLSQTIMKIVKYNSPEVHVIAGPRDGLEQITILAKNQKGIVLPVSNYWFHHPAAMQLAGQRFGVYMAKEKSMPKPSGLVYVSNSTGKQLRPSEIAEDLVKGVYRPVKIFTVRGPSLHGSAHRNGYLDVLVFNREFVSWLAPSRYVATHLAANYNGLSDVKHRLMQIIEGNIAPGKQYTIQTKPLQQLSHSSPSAAQN